MSRALESWKFFYFQKTISSAIYNGSWQLVINLLKTKEIVFRRPNPRLHISPLPIPGVQQVSSAVLLGVTLCDTLSFTAHVDNMLKICSQRLYLLKLLRDQGLPRHYLKFERHFWRACTFQITICNLCLEWFLVNRNDWTDQCISQACI